MSEHNLWNTKQSAYKTGHSVETTPLALQSYLLGTLDSGRAALTPVQYSVRWITNYPLMWWIYNLDGFLHLSGKYFRVKFGTIHSRSHALRTWHTPVPGAVCSGQCFSTWHGTVFPQFEIPAYLMLTISSGSMWEPKRTWIFHWLLGFFDPPFPTSIQKWTSRLAAIKYNLS